MRKIALSITAVVALAVAGTATAATTTVSPAVAKGGALVKLTGTGFPHSASGHVYVAGRAVASIHSSAGGSFAVRFRAPSSTGKKKVLVKIGSGHVANVMRVAAHSLSSSSTASSVGQRLFLMPARGAAGTKLNLTGTGFPHNGAIQIQFGGVQQAAATASAKGAFKKAFRVPPSPSGTAGVVIKSSKPDLRAPFTVRSCGVKVCLPYILEFNRNQGGLKDKDGQGTGFMTTAPTKTGSGYSAQKLDVSGGQLHVTTSSGIAFGNSNSQENALGVGVDAAHSVLRIETTLVNLPAGTGNSEQAGVWFGLDQSNYVKMNVASDTKVPAVASNIKFEIENKNQQAAQPTKKVALSGDSVSLGIVVDNRDRKVEAYYRFPGGSNVVIGAFRAPDEFFDSSARAGIYATDSSAVSSVVYDFERFFVQREGTAFPFQSPGTGGTWSKAPADMPKLTLDAGSGVIGGLLYAVGGKFCCDKHISSMWSYDPVADSWKSEPSLPAAYSDPDPGVEDIAAVGANGKLYAFGGAPNAFAGAKSSAAVYDPVTQNWTMLPAMPTARTGATANAIGGKIYVAGGVDSTGASVASVDVLDIASGTWDSAAHDMNAPRSHHASAVMNGKLYVFGGRNRLADGTESPGILNTGEKYDPVTDTWTAIHAMPSARRSPDAGVLQGCAVVVGGEKKGTFPGTFYETQVYDPGSDSWESMAGMPTARHGAAAGVLLGDLYVAGGAPQTGSTFTDVNEKFSLPSGKTC